MVLTNQSTKTQSTTDHSSTRSTFSKTNQNTFISNMNYKEPQRIEAELSDCHKKLKDLERLIQMNKSVTPNKIESHNNSPRQ